MYHHFVDWHFRAVTRRARLLRRQGNGPSRLYVDIEGYPKNAALVLIKNTLKRWLRQNPGFCILIVVPALERVIYKQPGITFVVSMQYGFGTPGVAA